MFLHAISPWRPALAISDHALNPLNRELNETICKTWSLNVVPQQHETDKHRKLVLEVWMR